MSTAIATRISKEDILAINEAAAGCRTALAELGENDMAGCLVVAESMSRLRNCLTPAVMQSVVALQGTAVGFKTDKDKEGGYKPEELRDFVIEATIRQFRLVGNECNVIAGRFYGAKAGFERLVKTFPELTGFADVYDVMETAGGNSKVQCIATFFLDGTPQKLARQKENSAGGVFDNRINVRANSGMTVDAIEGKARRKFYAWIYDRLCGSLTDTPEGEIGEDGATPPKELVPMFAGGAVKEEAPPADDGCPLMVAEYRGKLAAVAERGEIGKTMAMAGRDARLSPIARRAIANLASEAQKIWPKRLDAETAPTSPPPTPPSPSDGPTESECLELDFTEEINNAATLGALLQIETNFAGNSKLDEAGVKRLVKLLTERREVFRKTREPRTNKPGNGEQTSFA